MREWQLRLADGKTVVWQGETGEDAARRYVDTNRDAAVVAVRSWPRHGVFVVDVRRVVG